MLHTLAIANYRSLRDLVVEGDGVLVGDDFGVIRPRATLAQQAGPLAKTGSVNDCLHFLV